MNQNRIAEEKFKAAILREQQGDLVSAVQTYASIANEYPEFRPVYIALGALYSKLGNLPDSLFCYEYAVRLSADFVTWFNIGSLHYRMNSYKKAIVSFEKSRKQNPSHHVTSLLLGLSYSRMKNHTAAERFFIESLSIVPGNEVALTALTMLYYDTGRFDEALDSVEKLALVKKDHPNMKKLRGKILFALGRLDDSEIDLRAAQEADPGFRNYTDFVEMIPVEVFTDRYGSIQDKIDSLEELVEANGSAKDMLSLSLVHLFTGDADNAMRYLLQAKKTTL